jgi:hypothetical protein
MVLLTGIRECSRQNVLGSLIGADCSYLTPSVRSRTQKCPKSLLEPRSARVSCPSMCDRCKAIDRDIANYRRIRASIDDETALALLSEVIEDLRAEKAALHPEEQEE